MPYDDVKEVAHDHFVNTLADMLPKYKDEFVELVDYDSDDAIEAQVENTQVMHEADEIEVK